MLKVFCVAFINGQVLNQPRGKEIYDATIIGEQEGGMYKLKGQPEQVMAHESMEPNELWN